MKLTKINFTKEEKDKIWKQALKNKDSWEIFIVEKTKNRNEKTKQ